MNTSLHLAHLELSRRGRYLKYPEGANFEAIRICPEGRARNSLPRVPRLTYSPPHKRNASRFSPRRRRASATNTGGVEGCNVVQSALVCQSPEFQNLAV